MQVLVMVHGIWRWVVLLTALLAIVGARIPSDSGQSGFGSKAGLWYMMAIDLQVLFGMSLWLLEKGWLLNAFYAYIHPLTMLAALLVAHGGRKAQKRANAQAAGFWPFVVSLVLVLLGIPWFM